MNLHPTLHPIHGVSGYFLGYDEEDKGNVSVWSMRGREGHERKIPRKLKLFKSNTVIGISVFYSGKKYKFYSLGRLICLAFHGAPPYPSAKGLMKDKMGLYNEHNFSWSRLKEKV